MSDGSTSGVPLTDAQVVEFTQAFAVFDKDNTGTITVEELGLVMRSLGRYPTTGQLEGWFAEVDRNGDGGIELIEFLNLMSERMTGAADFDQLKESFGVLDKDGNGYVSAAELRHVLTNLGEKLTEAEVDALIRSADLDEDAQISFDEFLAMMMDA